MATLVLMLCSAGLASNIWNGVQNASRPGGEKSVAIYFAIAALLFPFAIASAVAVGMLPVWR